MTLPEKLLAIHRALAAAGVEHAFGGAIALAYATLDPRGTSDIDLNVFAPADRPQRALSALPPQVAMPDDIVERISRDGQCRAWWAETPLDLFFDTVDVHRRAADHRRRVPFAGVDIPVLGPVELTVFKAMSDRTKDWADIEAMISAGTVDFEEAREVLRSLVDPGDERLARLAEAERRAGRA